MTVGAEDAVLEASRLTMSYGATKALNGVDFSANRGEVVAISGSSGSGKSTLLLCLAGIVRPDSGTVTFAGNRVDDAPESLRSRLRRTEFGVLFQFSQLIAELTAEENVALPLILDGQSRRAAVEMARHRLSELDITDLGNRRPTEMSGGQAQRVALARAIVTNPSILFADEPTGSLDSENSDKVLELLVRLSREHGMTLLLVTHDPIVAAVADRSVRMFDGTISATDDR